MPRIEEGVPAADWTLSPEGVAAAAALAAQLTRFDFRAIASSGEPKAVGTATAIAQALKLPVEIDDDFAETSRRTVGFLTRAQIDSGIRRLFENPSEIVYGEESADAACARFAAAIERQLQKGADDIAVVTHGTILSVYLGRTGAVADVFAFWKSLKLPDAILLDGASVERLV
ncbi:MAG: histidine phosphatase family protein [Alphaproteobacteria bacterium]|nr:histidine phosphatase family protein [Alphaproteobacteria bacterium]